MIKRVPSKRTPPNNIKYSINIYFYRPYYVLLEWNYLKVSSLGQLANYANLDCSLNLMYFGLKRVGKISKFRYQYFRDLRNFTV